MTLLERISQLWTSIQLMDFRGKRDEFYLQLAKSLERKERLRTFLLEEQKISKAKATRDSSREIALNLMLQKLSHGQEFKMSQILSDVVPKEDRLLLSSVDFSKDKPETLRALVSAIREQKEAKSLLIKALVPPFIMLPGVFIFSYILATQSIPVIAKIAPPEVWTPFNASVRNFSEGVADYGFLVIGAMASLVLFFAYQMPRWSGKWRGRIERIPQKMGLLLFPVFPIALPLSIYRDFQVTLLLTSLAVLLKSGASLTTALDSLRSNSQPWMQWHLRRVTKHLYIAPTEYVEAFAEGLLSPKLLARLATTIRSDSRFDRVLIELGTQGVIEVRKEIQSSSKGLNTLLMIASAACVLFLYVGQLSIAQSMTEALDPVSKMKSYQ
ncbi:type II secretion system F family protein [Limnobacter parvus]|uniref:Type II secretion system F family protein n=1 Tax=Limnobacter parvus TaxID=2939690 RepID=A0ABT1XL55_9BURK|nr:type II secretion system F family protein [Limnobacter parvus]MCR2747609.1 type II secretion system F family protein [Limnobacter parvus]